MSKKKKKKQKIKRLFKPKIKDDANISEAIVQITNSFLENIEDDFKPPFRTMLGLSIIAWNISLFPDNKQGNVYEQVISQIPKAIGAEKVAALVVVVEKLIEEKNKYFPDIKRIIQSYDISENKDGFKLDIKSAPIKDE